MAPHSMDPEPAFGGDEAASMRCRFIVPKEMVTVVRILILGVKMRSSNNYV